MTRSLSYPHDRFLARTVLRLLPPAVLPNHLTIVRLILTPFAVLFVWQQWYGIAIPFFLFVAATDALDGSLARTRNAVTEWGMVWDPIADKILIGSVAGILLLRGFPIGLAAAILGLEALFVIGAYHRKRHGRIAGANAWGKGKMLLQVIGVALYLYALAYHSPWLAVASFTVLAVAVVFAIISLVTHSA